MEKTGIRFAPGSLLQSLKESTKRARRRGAIHSINTDQQFIEQGGVRFLVRSVSALARKDQARISEAEKASDGTRRDNPFLPYDPDVFVTDISPTHVGLLNKYNVLEHHLLIVTREFQHQEALLTRADFEALWTCLIEMNGLGFYNGGTAAGASQPHKHLQVVPLPIASEGPDVPMAPLLQTVAATGLINTLPGLPFIHAFYPHALSLPNRSSAAVVLHQYYLDMLDRLGLTTSGTDDESRGPKPYNLLVTSEWMLLVPRSQEHFDSISINALGFAGSLFVRNPRQIQELRRHGPMNVLRAVAFPCD